MSQNGFRGENEVLRVTVYGSSSKNTPQKFIDSAFALGQLMATKGLTCVNGGGMNGVMGGMNRGCRSLDGNIIGIIHEQFCVDDDEDMLITNMIVCKGDDLEERKQLLLDNGDCILVMPGGVGTMDELWDAVTSKSLGFSGLKYKPICLVNLDGFFDGTICQLKKAFDEKMLYLQLDKYFHVVNTPEEGLDWLVEEVKRVHPSSFAHAHDSLEERHESRIKERKQIISQVTHKPAPEVVPSHTISEEILHHTHIATDHVHVSSNSLQTFALGAAFGLFIVSVLQRQ